MVAVMDAVRVDGAVLVSPFTIYGYDASYALEVHRQHPGRFGLVQPVDATDPGVAETIADWVATPGTVGIRLLLNRSVATDAVNPGEGTNEEEREGPHPPYNAHPEGGMRNLPDHPGHGNLLKPTGGVVTQVAEPEVEEIAVSEGNEQLKTHSASWTPHGRLCSCHVSVHTCGAIWKGWRCGDQGRA
jgi:hypothetical protein